MQYTSGLCTHRKSGWTQTMTLGTVTLICMRRWMIILSGSHEMWYVSSLKLFIHFAREGYKKRDIYLLMSCTCTMCISLLVGTCMCVCVCVGGRCAGSVVSLVNILPMLLHVANTHMYLQLLYNTASNLKH